MELRDLVTPKTLFCVILVFLLAVGTVSAVPPWPDEFSGTITISGNQAPAGMYVVAQVNGIARGSAYTGQGGVYDIAVMPLESDLQQGPPTITFWINGIKADRDAVFVAGGATNLNLNFGAVTVVSPVAHFNANPQSGSVPLTVTFTDTSTGFPSSWQWNFGDGSATSNLQNPTHTFSAIRSYSVTLTVGNSAGTSSTSKIIVATAVPVTTSPTQTTTTTPTGGQSNGGVPVVPMNLHGNVYVGNPPTAAPIGTTIEARGTGVMQVQGVNPVTITVAGVYGDDPKNDALGVEGNGIPEGAPIQFYVDGSLAQCYYNGVWQNSFPFQSATIQSLDLRTSFAPTAAFSGGPLSGTPPLSVQFTDESSGSPTQWAWNFGDNSVSTSQNPSHVYRAIGQYTVTLTVLNEFGNNTATRQNYVFVFTNGGSGGGGGGGGGSSGGGGGTSGTPTPNVTATPVVTIPPVVPVTIVSGDNIAAVQIPINTNITGGSLDIVNITRIDPKNVPPVPAGAMYAFTGYAYDIEPAGATFDPYVTLQFTIPEQDWASMSGKDLSIKWFNPATSSWVDMPTTVDPTTRTVSAQITNGGIYGLFTIIPPTPVPTTAIITTIATPTKAPPVLPFLPFDFGTLLRIIIVIIIVIAAVVVAIYFLRRRKPPAESTTTTEPALSNEDIPPDWLDLK
jgi:PKD repeat protein